MITFAGHQVGPPGPEPTSGAFPARPTAALPGPAPGHRFAAFVGTPGAARPERPEATAPETEPGEDTPLTGAVAADPVAAAHRPGEKTAGTAEPVAHPPAADGPAAGQRRDPAQIGIHPPQSPVMSGEGQETGIAAAGTAISRPPPPAGVPVATPPESPPAPATTAPVTTAPMLLKSALQAGESLAAVSGHRVVAAAPAPRAAPAIPAAPLATMPPAAPPPQAGFSTALAEATGAASDSAGFSDTALGASGQRAPAPLATALAPPVQPASAGQDIPRQIAVQIARAAEGGAGPARGTVEISLSPEELGRVHLRLHPSEAGLSVTITADRPETLDLMRRNIDILAREFLEIGFEGAKFDFAQGGPGADSDPNMPGPDAAPAAAADPAPGPASPEPGARPPATSLVPGERLDLRL
jgi:hypothetical protein